MTDLRPLRLRDAGDNPALAWAEGERFFLPRELVRVSGLEAHLDGQDRLRLPKGFRLAAAARAAAALRELRAFPMAAPLSSRLPFSYRRVPAVLRQLAAKAIGLRQRGRAHVWGRFPAWPLDLSADFLSDLGGEAPSPLAGGPTPVLLTHDLDSAEGLANLGRSFLALEEAAGARSLSFVVPFSWPLDVAALEAVQERGHALGVHGFDHGNRTWRLPPEERRQRLERTGVFARRFGAHGYRAPSLLRSRALLRDLRGIFAFDSSLPTSGGLFPVPNNGCASARPFPVEGLAEIPLTMPRDGSLLFLHHSPKRILELWKACATAIARSGGVVVLLTHCEDRFSGRPRMLAVYEAFLDFIASSDRFRFAGHRDVLAAWRASLAPAAPGDGQRPHFPDGASGSV